MFQTTGALGLRASSFKASSGIFSNYDSKCGDVMYDNLTPLRCLALRCDGCRVLPPVILGVPSSNWESEPNIETNLDRKLLPDFSENPTLRRWLFDYNI